MSKSKKNKDTKTSSAKVTLSKKDLSTNFIPKKYQTPVFLAIILLLIFTFFNSGLFGGKVFSSADNIASASFDTYLNDAKKDGIFPLWIPYIFNGMPSFAALVPHLERTYDLSHTVWITIRDFFYMLGSNNSVWSVALFYIIFAFSFYFLADYKFKNKLIALYCAIASVFITPIIQFIIVGHNSKMIAVMMFPLVFLFTERIYDYFSEQKKNIFKLLLYFTALVFFIHVQMSSNHIQMLFYFYFAMGIYLLYRLIFSLVKKHQIKVSLKTIGVFALALGFSALMYADSYLSIKEYNKYSIRGVPSITGELPENKDKPKNTEPLDYEYATNWSFSPGEVMTLLIPYWQGFGDVEYKGQKLNTYWGQMPFTTSPVYFGVITLFLAIAGIYYNFRKNILVQALTLISIISLLLSFGRTFPVLFDLMFYHFPFFSSFRAPVMIHILINVSMVILAGFGIKSILGVSSVGVLRDNPSGEISADKSRSSKFLLGAKYLFPLLAFPILISIIGFEGYYSSLVSSSPLLQKLQAQGASSQQIQQYLGQISTIAYENVKSEMLIIGLLLVLTYGACYLLIKRKIKIQFFLIGIIVLTIFDLWHIDFKTLHWDNKSESENFFKTPDYVDWILKNDPEFSGRVLEINQGQPVRGNNLAYWRLQSLYGYQGAKLRIYQDMDDVAGVTNPMVWNLTNTKYIISDLPAPSLRQAGQPYKDTIFSPVYKGSKYILLNRNYLPRAFFVSSYKTANGLEILNNIKQNNFDPKQVAFFEKDLSAQAGPNIKIDPPDSSAKIQITNYGIHNITLDAEASGNNLLFLSEVYYPAGWTAVIDGQPTEIYKTNYLFRSIIVPKGKHKIEFKFEPETYYNGKKISIASNLVLIAVFVIAVVGFFLRRKKIAGNKQTENISKSQILRS